MCLDCERKLERHGENMKTPSRTSLMWGHSANHCSPPIRGKNTQEQEETSNKTVIREVIYWNWLGEKKDCVIIPIKDHDKPDQLCA